MEENVVTYVGEHLAIGNWGKFAVYLSLAASLFSAVAYFLSFKNPSSIETGNFWRKMGRAGFFAHGAAVAAIFTILFFIIQKHYFEYQYAWQHSSRELPLKYMISCFWEGQEGSFLLWMVWHALIGLVLIFTARSWESPVMTIIALAQVMLSTMLIGIEFFGHKIGSSPFDLLRDRTPGPIFSRPDYLNFIEDGNGLNPLLQNYWMVIHPPTLFFGFAATIVPFAYAVSALWTRRYTEWVKPAIPWALVAVMVLGTGIIMGGFWAYESLSFGGYWAWDPVENASLIPWLIVISAVHLMLVYKSTGNALYSTYILTIFSFILVLYATFLTRSGILGDTSVHSFTDLGMSGQLLLFLFVFFWLPSFVTINNTKLRWGYLALTALVFGYAIIFEANKWVFIPYVLVTFFFFFRNIYVVNPIKGKEEEFSSREFWMFIGAILFIVSCLHVLLSTSLPVYNKLTGQHLALPADDMKWYNDWQIVFAMLIAVVMAVGQFFKYKKTGEKFYFNNIVVSLTIALGVTTACIFLFKIREDNQYNYIKYLVFMLTGVFAVVGNVYYVVRVLRGKMSFSGASVAHIGFGLLLVGVLVSSVNKQVISQNVTNTDFGEDYDEAGQREHLLLYKDVPMPMGPYEVTYLGDSVNGANTYYKMHYRQLDKEGNHTGKEFYLYPHLVRSKKSETVSVNPDTRHYVSHDVYTFISQVLDKQKVAETPYDKVYRDSITMGDTIYTNNALVILEGHEADEKFELTNFMLTAKLKLVMLTDTLQARPQFKFVNGEIVSPEETVSEAGLQISFTSITPPNPEKKTPAYYHFAVGERPIVRDYVVLKAQVMPWINLVWAGTIVMVIGFLMSIARRVKEYRTEQNRNRA